MVPPNLKKVKEITMVLSIGVDYNRENWKTCLLEDGQPVELQTYNNTSSTLEYLQHTCALYPEPIIAISSGLNTRLTLLNTLIDQQLSELADHLQHQHVHTTKEFLTALNSFNLSSYSLPPVRQLPSIPAHRQRRRLDMGTSEKLCAITTLLYRMRRQEAIWQEMSFLYLDASHTARSIVVVENGRIVNGIGERAGYASLQQEQLDQQDESDHSEDQALAEQAFWEGLIQDLAGLMAIHHLEDVVVTGPHRNAVLERLEDRYQFYDFPRSPQEQIGFEAAIGASIIAEGLYHPGIAAEVVQRLELPQAGARPQERIIVPGT